MRLQSNYLRMVFQIALASQLSSAQRLMQWESNGRKLNHFINQTMIGNLLVGRGSDMRNGSTHLIQAYYLKA
jgi:hypothetical protein